MTRENKLETYTKELVGVVSEKQALPVLARYLLKEKRDETIRAVRELAQAQSGLCPVCHVNRISVKNGTAITGPVLRGAGENILVCDECWDEMFRRCWNCRKYDRKAKRCRVQPGGTEVKKMEWCDEFKSVPTTDPLDVAYASVAKWVDRKAADPDAPDQEELAQKKDELMGEMMATITQEIRGWLDPILEQINQKLDEQSKK